MTTLLRSLPLNPAAWDLVLDSSGNWNLFTDAYLSTAQDVACAELTFQGECLYDSTLGLPYYQSIFGQDPPLSYLTAKLEGQALTMSNVARCVVVALGLDKTRSLRGSLLVWPLGSSTPVPVTL